MKNPKLGVSVLSVQNFTLFEKIKQLDHIGIDYFHIDIMDGNFVPNMSSPPSLYRDIYRTLPNACFDLHFMVTEKALGSLLPVYLQSSPQYVTVHREALSIFSETALLVRKAGAKFGLAINPDTDLTTIQDFLPELDLVLLMSVVPGYGGQKFIETTYKKLQTLDNIREKEHLSFLIQVDGGINLAIAKQLISLNANLIVIGSDLISDLDPKTYLHRFRSL